MVTTRMVFLSLLSLQITGCPRSNTHAPTEVVPDAQELGTLTIELRGSQPGQRAVLGSAHADPIAPDSVEQHDDVLVLEFQRLGPDAYTFGLVKLDRSTSTFETSMELPLWVEGNRRVLVDARTAQAEGDIDPSWIAAFELAQAWSARAEALAQHDDSAGLATLDHELGELIAARTEPLATLLELHRARALAATLPAGDRLEEFATRLDGKDPRWALISRQLPVLARTAAHREEATRILEQLLAAHPAESVRAHAALWLAEQAQSVGDLERAADYRATVPTRLLGLNASPEHPLALGKLVPNIALPDLHEPRRMHELHGRERPLLVMIWSPWCGMCKVEIPWWSLAHRRFGDRLDFLVVATAATRDEVLTGLDEQALVGDIAFLDEAQSDALTREWACPSTPQLLLLDREGRVSAGTKSLRGAEMLVVLGKWLRGHMARR